MRTALAVMAAFLLCRPRRQPPPGRGRDARGRRQGAGRRDPPPHRRQRPCRRAAGPLVQGKAPERGSTSCRSPTCTRRRAMPTEPVYEVYALKYGERDTTKCQFFYREGSHDKLTLHYFVWLILGGPYPVLVDTGFLEDDARERHIRDYVSPATVVEKVGREAGRHPGGAHQPPALRPLGRPQPVPQGGVLDPEGRGRVLDGTVRQPRWPSGDRPTSPRWPGWWTLNYANRIKIVEGEREVLPGRACTAWAATPPGLQSSP